MNERKMDFAITTNEHTKSLAHQNMAECEHYGITWGCDIDCPVLNDGRCELKDSENKELYEEVLKGERDENRLRILFKRVHLHT